MREIHVTIVVEAYGRERLERRLQSNVWKSFRFDNVTVVDTGHLSAILRCRPGMEIQALNIISNDRRVKAYLAWDPKPKLAMADESQS